MTGPALLLAAVLGGLAAVERKAFLQAQLSRPIVLCTAIGWALGDAKAGLMIGAPLELLWIGAANLGAALPPHETAASAAIAAAGVAAGGGPSAALLAFLLFAPVSILGKRLEGIGERANERLVAHAAVALGEGMPERALRLHLAGLWRPFLTTGALVFVAGLWGPILAWLDDRLPPFFELSFGLCWALIWAAGGVMAMRSARLPRGLPLAIAGAVAALLLWFLVGVIR